VYILIVHCGPKYVSISPWADPGFWFGRGTARGLGDAWDGRPQRGPGTEPPQKPEECYVIRMKNTQRKKSRDWHCMTISSSHSSSFCVSSHFVLKYKTQRAGFKAREMVHNDSRSGI